MPKIVNLYNHRQELTPPVEHENILWKFSVLRHPKSDQYDLFAEFIPIEKDEAAEYDAVLKAFTPGNEWQSRRRQKFRMCGNSALIATKMISEYQNCKIEIYVKKETLFGLPEQFTPVPNITDAMLLVGQESFDVCKKILAQKSTWFYDLFYADGAPPNKLYYYLPNIDSQDFRRFLQLLCNHQTMIPREHFRAVAMLAKKFGAEQCARECEKWLMKIENMTGKEKLELAEGLGYTVLRDYVMMQLKTPEEVDSINSRFDVGLGEKLIKKTEELDSERAAVVLLKKEVMLRIHKVPFRFSCSPGEQGKNEITIDCNWEDTSNPWKCDFTIECIHNGVADEPETYNFDWLNSRIKFTKLASKLRVTDICFAGVFPEQTIDFEVPREKLVDVEFEIGDKTFYASKQILANASAEFHEMFFSNDTDKKMGQTDKEIASPEDFDELLQHIYFPDRNVTEDKIEGLLRLSEKLKITRIKNKCKLIMVHENSISEILRLKLWQMYFPDSLPSLFVMFRTFRDLKMLSKMDGFCDLKSVIRGAISLAIRDSDNARKYSNIMYCF